MNNVCSGITWTKEAFTKVMASQELTHIDPDNLILAYDKDFNGLQGEDAWEKNWDGAVAMCRAWYDAKNHGKAFCCQSNAAGEDV